MPDESTPTPPANPTPTPPSQEPKWKAEFGDSFDPDRAFNTIEAQRKAERDATKRADAAERKLKDRDDSEKTELEKLTSRATELEQRVQGYEQREREAGLRSQVAAVAQKAGAHYPEDVYALVHQTLEVGDDGKVLNADSVVRSLKESRPALFQRQSADAAAGRKDNNRGAGSVNEAMRLAAGR